MIRKFSLVVCHSLFFQKVEASKNEHLPKYHVSSDDVTSFWDPDISKLSEKSYSNSRIDVCLFVCTRVSIGDFFLVISGTSNTKAYHVNKVCNNRIIFGLVIAPQ